MVELGLPHDYRIGVKLVLIGILTTVSGIDFDEANREPVMIEAAGRSVPFMGRRALLANK